MNILLRVANQIAEPANDAINHAIDKIGLGSIATTVGIKAAENAEVIEQGLTFTDWSARIAMVGAILFAIKTFLDIIYGLEKRYHRWKESRAKAQEG